MVVVPVRPHANEAHRVCGNGRQQPQQVGKPGTIRCGNPQHHDGDDDGNHAIAERFHPALVHVAPSRCKLGVPRITREGRVSR